MRILFHIKTFLTSNYYKKYFNLNYNLKRCYLFINMQMKHVVQYDILFLWKENYFKIIVGWIL